MAIHILGNGPSLRSLFDRTRCCHPSDIVVGCNFSDTSYSPHYTVIIDIRAIKQFMSTENPYILEIDAVISTRAYRYLEDHWGWENVKREALNVVDTFELIQDRKVSKNLGMNSGQHAAVYSIQKYPKEKEIHIWGTDSFWTHDVSSSTDPIARPRQRGPRVRPHITRSWNKYWKKIFDDYSRNTFIIHCIEGAKVDRQIQESENVKTEFHS